MLPADHFILKNNRKACAWDVDEEPRTGYIEQEDESMLGECDEELELPE